MDRSFQIKAIGMQHDFISLNLGKINDIIDDHQQRFARTFDRIDKQALFIVQIGFSQQISYAHNPIHGGSDFMAHIRQKCGFGAIGGLGMDLCGLQLLFVIHTFGDIQRQTDNIPPHGRGDQSDGCIFRSTVE